MSKIDASEFASFFEEVHGHSPFPWQERLAKLVCTEGWPKVMDLPTASGKTACIDIALFALAVRGNDAPRRVFFVVDRRIIVSEAYRRAQKIADRLRNATEGFLARMSTRLRELGSDRDQPLQTYQLRGGAFRDEMWVRSPLQVAVMASTVDQVGSRLLFRGYGVGDRSWPIHAGLIANDSILFLDEAHCSKAFAQTLEAVEHYRSKVWASGFPDRSFHFVEMTATPGRAVSEEQRFCINQDDREHPVLRQRLFATKLVRLPEPVKCRKEETGKFAAALIEAAVNLSKEVDGKRVAILVNRIITAQAVHQELYRRGKPTTLVIGRMRPFDRDKQSKELEPFKAGEQRPHDAQTHFVVSTQCLEVGADYDFDVMVSECASIDALQQRFGRLDRLGQFERAQGAVLVGSWQLGAKGGDPIYGEALKSTWNFLQTLGAPGEVNMGIESGAGESKTVAEAVREQAADKQQQMRLESKTGPKLLPSHLDALVQTSPRPVQEPDIDLFLHGPEKGRPDVYVIWRRDLNSLRRQDWHDVVSLCPPTSPETMPVSLWTFKKWFEGAPKREVLSDESDLEVASYAGTDERRQEQHAPPEALVWRGKDEATKPPTAAADFRPGDTVVLAESTQSWNDLGYIPGGYQIDLGDVARLQLRRSITLRLHPEVMKEWWDEETRKKIESMLAQDDIDEKELRNELEQLAKLPLRLQDSDDTGWWENFVESSTLSRYPAGEGRVLEGFFGKKEKRKNKRVFLWQHLCDVATSIEKIGGGLTPAEIEEVLQLAAKYHDYGKVDVRFQTWLRNGDRSAAELAPVPIAKSGIELLRKQSSCGLPQDFRHELLSLQFAERSGEFVGRLRNLGLHLVASHHGCCRPLPPVVLDSDPPCVEFEGVEICSQERLHNPPHRLASGISDRFWLLTREYGWWGLTYLEAMLRLADWDASDNEQVEVTE